MYSAIHWFGINRNLFLSNLGLSWVSIILTFHNLSTPRKCQSRSFRRRSADTIPSRAKHNQKKVFHNIVALLQLQNVGDHWEHVLCWFWPRQDRCLSGWLTVLRRCWNENKYIYLDPHQGDSGGPLTTTDQSRSHTLLGILSQQLGSSCSQQVFLHQKHKNPKLSG